MASITITGMDELLAKLGKLEHVHLALQRPMDISLKYMQNQLMEYPAKAAGAFSALATPGQKRAYWARVRSGDINHGDGGYIRQRMLGNAWATEIQSGLNGMRGIVGNNSPGAIFVQGERQQPFHRASGWKTVDQVADESEGFVRRTFEAEFRKITR